MPGGQVLGCSLGKVINSIQCVNSNSHVSIVNNKFDFLILFLHFPSKRVEHSHQLHSDVPLLCKQVRQALAFYPLQHLPLLVVLFLFQSFLSRVPCIRQIVQLSVYHTLIWQLVRYVELHQFVSQHIHLRRLVFLQFYCHRLAAILPLAAPLVKVPVSQHKVSI